MNSNLHQFQSENVLHAKGQHKFKPTISFVNLINHTLFTLLYVDFPSGPSSENDKLERQIIDEAMVRRNIVYIRFILASKTATV